jgi:hypothetical protein
LLKLLQAYGPIPFEIIIIWSDQKPSHTPNLMHESFTLLTEILNRLRFKLSISKELESREEVASTVESMIRGIHVRDQIVPPLTMD